MSLKGEISLIRTLTDHAVWQGDLALRGAWVDLLLRPIPRTQFCSKEAKP